jgi:Putative transposase, YhgA-like
VSSGNLFSPGGVYHQREPRSNNHRDIGTATGYRRMRTMVLSTVAGVQLPGSYVDENLAPHHSDLLLRVPLKTGNNALAYLLVEHKSSPDPLARLQLLRYITRILTRWSKQHQKSPLPPIVPIVVHHGPEGWEYATDFSDLYGDVPDALRPYLISFRHSLIDLVKIADSDLSTHLRARSFLKAMKYIRHKDLPDRIRSVLQDASRLLNEDVFAILFYIAKGPIPVSLDIVSDALSEIEPRRVEEIMQGFGAELAARYIEEAKRKITEESFGRGLDTGKISQGAKSLTRLLERRIGPLPDDLRKRIASADLPLIQVWFDRAIDAPDFQSVFRP